MSHRVPLPEISSILQRAHSNRLLVDQLLDHVPEDRWDNRAEGDAWPARAHLAHLATIDTLTLELLTRPEGNAFQLNADVLMRRTLLINEVVHEPVDQLRERMRSSRAALREHIASFDEDTLAHDVVIATPGAYPPEQSVSLRAYLAAWAEHDAEHTEAIRAAVTASIQPGALSATVRLRRERGA